MPSDSQIAQLLSSAHDAQQRGDQATAARRLEEVLARDAQNPLALNALGMQALARGDSRAAGDYFLRAAQADPAAPALWVNVATARRNQGDDDGERAALLAVLDLDQRHLTANIRLAELHERLGETGQANYRWGAVLALGNAMPDRPPALDALLAHAGDYVATRGRELGEMIEAGLEQAREGLAASQRRRFDACIDVILGRRRVFHNECSGIHFPFLPADEFFDREHFPWLAELEAQTDTIRGEFEALLAEELPGFTPYVAMESGLPDNKWTALDHSLDWSALHLWRHGERIDEACRGCPRTAEILDSVPRAHVPRRMPTAFFSVLKPRTHLPAHTGVSNLRAIIHLPLIVPPGCRFRVGGETREWRVGEAFAFDDTIDHEAWNDSDQLRAVLIFDTWNPHISATERALLDTFFRITDESGLDPGGSAAVMD
jgi:aspartyl/asparaginyl beta-hydroxylase (cupin superfamily)